MMLNSWFFSIFTRKSVTSLSDHWKLDLITTTTIHKSRWYLPDSRYEVATTSWSTVNNKGRKKHLHFSYQPDESLTFAFKMTHSSMMSLSVVRKVMLVLCRKVMVRIAPWCMSCCLYLATSLLIRKQFHRSIVKLWRRWMCFEFN